MARGNQPSSASSRRSGRRGRDSSPALSPRTVRERAAPAVQHWEAAIRAFDPYPDRLRDLADAAHEQAQVLMMAELAQMPWPSKPGAREISLAEGLEPAGGREGPETLWKAFDRQLRALGEAMEGDQNRPVYEAFDALSDALDALADAIDPPAEVDDDDDEAETG
jgi:hypothetical protein